MCDHEALEHVTQLNWVQNAIYRAVFGDENVLACGLAS